jgi:hypothetical protein
MLIYKQETAHPKASLKEALTKHLLKTGGILTARANKNMLKWLKRIGRDFKVKTMSFQNMATSRRKMGREVLKLIKINQREEFLWTLMTRMTPGNIVNLMRFKDLVLSLFRMMLLRFLLRLFKIRIQMVKRKENIEFSNLF